MQSSHFHHKAVAPRYITAPEIGLCVLLEAVLGPLFVFFAYSDVPSKWTLIGGSLLLFVLAIHESRPLFEKSKEVYRTMSKRFSSRFGDDIAQDVQSTIDISQTEVNMQDEEKIVAAENER